MTDTVTSQNIELPFGITLYNASIFRVQCALNT